jgi:Cu/Ag efflux protein CusF
MKPFWFAVTGCAIVGLSLLIGCSGGSTKSEREYPIRGRVVAVSKDQITLDHEAIPGYMGAMEMSFAVSKPELLQGLQPGDQVHGTLNAGDGSPVITQLQKNQAPSR